MLRNKYVSVVVEGKLDTWTGANPDKFPKAKNVALFKAALFREQGKTAYAVVVEEILDEDHVN